MGFDYSTYIGLEKQTLGGHKQNLACNRTQEKGAVTPQETDPGLPVSVQKSPIEAWVSGGQLQVGDTECGTAFMQGTFEEGQHNLHYLHHSFSDQTIGKKHNPTHQQKIGLKIY